MIVQISPFLLVSFIPVIRGNWLHQCSQCVDQSLYSDMSLKTDIRPANTTILYEQMKRMQLREFEHIEKEFFNRFFSRTQLGLIAQELQPISPGAVALIPERRYTSANGTQISAKNVLMVRESHVLFVLLGGLQEISSRLEVMDKDYWSRIGEWDRVLGSISGRLGEVSNQYSLIDQSVQQAGAKVAFLSERSDGVMKGLRELEDRLSDARAQVTVLNERLVRGLETHENFLGELREKNSHLQLLVGKQESELKTITEKLNSVSDQTASVSHRLSLVETALFLLLNERKAVVEESKNYEKNRVSFILLLLKLEKQRTVRSALTRELSYELASRREAFDRHLLALKEESDLRVLSAKSKFEKDAQELQLKFEREKLSVDMAVRIEEARIESEMRMRDRRENEDVNLRELAEKNLAEKNKLAAIIQQTAEIVSSWVVNVYSNPETLMLVIGSILGLVAGVYVAKEGAQLAREEIGRRLGKPELVRVTSKNSSFFSNFFSKKKELKDAFSDVVLPADLADQIKRLAVATRAARLSKTPLLNMMFYGEPGTGKTMVAKRFAEFSGLDYAIMSGGDIAPLGAQAVTEIHKLFKWVNSSSKGVVLFVDEAESFLAQRTGGMSENLRNAITALLYHTGTASSKFMMIIATNRPGDLDTAVIDRIDERIEFPLPNLGERERLVKMYFGTFVSQVKDEKVAEALKRVAVRVKGFSGREISKLMMSVNSHQYFESKCSLIELLESVTETKVREHDKIRRMASVGYAFDQSTLDCSDTDRCLSKI